MQVGVPVTVGDGAPVTVGDIVPVTVGVEEQVKVGGLPLVPRVLSTQVVALSVLTPLHERTKYA